VFDSGKSGGAPRTVGKENEMRQAGIWLVTGVFGLSLAGAAAADDVEGSVDDRGDRIERWLDRRGDRIEERLDRRGDRIDRRLDRKGARIDRHLDRKGARIARRADRRQAVRRARR
jgi:hypothetical protein